jgi:hypothetical protein
MRSRKVLDDIELKALQFYDMVLWLFYIFFSKALVDIISCCQHHLFSSFHLLPFFIVRTEL